MMMRKKSNPWARAKYLYVLPLAAVAVVAFARPEISEPLDEISKVKVNDLAVIAEVNPVKSVETEIPVTKVKVSGTVCDGETKEPVKGAAVLVKGGTLGTVTDADGKFMLMDVPAQAVLQVSMIGMETADIILGDSPEQTGIQVYLKKDGLKVSDSDKELVLRGQMEELSVIGYSSSSDEPAGKGRKEKKPVSVQNAFMVVENMPEFPGGMRACMEFLARNIKYPVECQKNGVQGRVIVQFIVKADGSVDSPEIMRSVDPLLDAEALRVVGLMPKWKPGTQKGEAVDVRFTIPIAFQIPADNREDTVTGAIESGDKSKKNVLVIVDGAVLEGGMSELKTINPETIEFVEVIKDQSRLPEYNAQGKEGVILITTNKKQ